MSEKPTHVDDGPKRAVALAYTPEDSADKPTVVAKGVEDLAAEILAIAESEGILVHQDPYLTEFLAKLDVGEAIPEALYHVIAELIAFSYVLQGKFPQSWAKQFGKISTQA